MKTDVLMERELLGGKVRQRSKSSFFSANDLVRAGNKWRAMNNISFFDMNGWLKSKSTKLFISEIEYKYGKAIIRGKGRGAQTWVHPLLFIDMALAINPKLKIEVYEWLFDHLIEFRNTSGDSYKKMCGSLFVRHKNKKTFADYIKTVATEIKNKCGVKDWQTANEDKLKLRDKIHENIAFLADVMNDNEQAVRIAIRKTSIK